MLRFVDSADHYSSLADKYNSSQNATVEARGRTGPNALNLNQWGSASTINKILDLQPTWIVGIAFRTNITSSNTATLFRFTENAVTTHVSLDLTTAMKLRLVRGGVQLGSDSAVTIALNTWYYVEVKVTIHDSAGVAGLKINGVDQVNLTGQDTQNGGSAQADLITFGGAGTSAFGNIDIDDIYMCDGTGSSPTNDYLGDVRVDALDPNGNGNSSQFTGSDGNSVDNYALVDESPPNGDTDYVESATVGNKDTYAYENHPLSAGTVYGVQVNVNARKTDAGTRKIVSVARLSGTEVDSAEHSLSSTYQYFRDIRETKPGGGSWSIADINGAEFGQKVSA
ncbi:MAG: hypothetical protein K0S82_36 [Gaiellaceae bacterium]|jgi:hypothetical protein|nr:hypothetical protein [Gaiellaceae bacterium]